MTSMVELMNFVAQRAVQLPEVPLAARHSQKAMADSPQSAADELAKLQRHVRDGKAGGAAAGGPMFWTHRNYLDSKNRTIYTEDFWNSGARRPLPPPPAKTECVG